MDRLKETEDLKAWLEEARGDWLRIAASADVSMRTLSTIANSPGYQATVSVIRKLKKARSKWKRL